jgi:hypothetical protein
MHTQKNKASKPAIAPPREPILACGPISLTSGVAIQHEAAAPSGKRADHPRSPVAAVVRIDQHADVSMQAVRRNPLRLELVLRLQSDGLWSHHQSLKVATVLSDAGHHDATV